MILCWIPLVMAGWVIPVSTSWHHSDLTPSAIYSIQSCTTGPAAYAKATMTGAYMAGAQYGFGIERHGFEFSVKPQLGLSYVDHFVKTLPASKNQGSFPQQYHVGGEINVCYERYCSGISYAHLSNGNKLGLCWSGADCRLNFGEDMVAFMAGVKFQ